MLNEDRVVSGKWPAHLGTAWSHVLMLQLRASLPHTGASEVLLKGRARGASVYVQIILESGLSCVRRFSAITPEGVAVSELPGLHGIAR